MTAPIWFRPTRNYCHYPKATSLKDQFEFTAQFIKEIEEICVPDAYNVIAYKHLGDVFYFFGLRKIFENIYKAPLHYIIHPKHEFLAKLWNVDNYSIFPIDELVRKNKKFIAAFFDDVEPCSVDLDLKLETPYLITAFSSIPQKGKPFFIEHIFNSFYEYPYYYCFRWAANLGIEEEFRYSVPEGDLPLSNHSQRVVLQLGGLENIILMAPEAATAVELPVEWWRRIGEALVQKGYSVLVNSKRIKVPGARSTLDLDLSLEEVVSIGLKCHAVFALRSGLADVLIGAGSRLYVINPAMLRREQFSLEMPFDKPTGVNEIQIYDWEVSDCIFEGIDIANILRQYVRDCQKSYYKCLFFSLFKKKKYRSSYKILYDIAGYPERYPDNNAMNPCSQNRNISFGILNLYKKIVYRKGNEKIKERIFLNGFVKVQKREESKKIKVFGIPIYSQKDGDQRVAKLLGIPIQRKDRSKDFFKYLKENIIHAAEEIYGKDTIPDHVFIVRHNIGETTLYLAGYQRWVMAMGARHPILLVWRERDISLFKLFLENCNSVRYLEISQNDINRFLKEDVTNLDGIMIHAPTFEIAESMKTQYPMNPCINFADWILKSMSLDGWGCPRLPKPSQAAENRATWLLNHKRITKPFVLLCPEAVSLKTVSDSFWSDVVDHFIESGFDVLINYGSSDKEVQSLANNVKTCSPDIEVLFAVAKRAERIITMASGLGVLLSLAERPVDLIYTDFKSEHIGYSSEFCQKIYSVHHMPWVETQNAVEHIATQLDELLYAIKSRKS